MEKRSCIQLGEKFPVLSLHLPGSWLIKRRNKLISRDKGMALVSA